MAHGKANHTWDPIQTKNLKGMIYDGGFLYTDDKFATLRMNAADIRNEILDKGLTWTQQSGDRRTVALQALIKMHPGLRQSKDCWLAERAFMLILFRTKGRRATPEQETNGVRLTITTPAFSPS